MPAPSVSVALPARNAAATLREALASLQRQDLEDFELIVVDHASTDSTGEIAEEVARGDDRLRVLRCEGSYIDACNLAWRAASGEFVARMDADDLAPPARLRTQRDLLVRQPDWSGCASRVHIRKRDGEGALVAPEGGYARYESWINGLLKPQDIARERFVDSPLPHPSMMLRRRVLEEAGGYLDLPWAEDYDLWLRLIEGGHRLGKAPEILLHWIDHPLRATRTEGRYAQNAFQEAKAHYLARLPQISGMGVVVCGAGPIGKDIAARLGRHEVIIHAFLEVNPRQIGQRISGIPVLASDQAPTFRGKAVMIAAVGREPGQGKIRELLTDSGFTEGIDFFRVA